MTDRKSIVPSFRNTEATPIKFKKNDTDKLPLFYEETASKSYYGIGHI
jgi:hypothetical protein